jgi:hypothetical protein
MMPGMRTDRGGRAPASTTSRTCTSTRPPLLCAASAIEWMSMSMASSTGLTLPRVSAHVPRTIATSTRNGL